MLVLTRGPADIKRFYTREQCRTASLTDQVEIGLPCKKIIRDQRDPALELTALPDLARDRYPRLEARTIVAIKIVVDEGQKLHAACRPDLVRDCLCRIRLVLAA